MNSNLVTNIPEDIYNTILDRIKETLDVLGKVKDKTTPAYFDVLHNLKNDYEYIGENDKADDIAKELIEKLSNFLPTPMTNSHRADILLSAYDTRALGICSTLMQDNFSASYTIESAINGIEDLRTNSELNYTIETMKQYVTTDEDGLAYFSIMSKYK